MRRYVFQFAMLAGMTLVPVLAMGDEKQDKEIAQAIVQKLQEEKKNGSLKGFSLDLQVEEGTVWLSGRVTSPEQQARALDVARRIRGVKQVVNDISITAATAAPKAKYAADSAPSQSRNMMASMNLPAEPVVPAAAATPRAQTPVVSPLKPSPTPMVSPLQQPVSSVLAARSEVGSGVQPSASPYPSGVQQLAARPLPTQPVAPNPGYGYGPTPPPAYSHQSQVPMAYAPARYIQHDGYAAGGGGGEGGYGGGGPVPMHTGGGMGIAPARYDHPSMPGHAWPSYAAYPNYAAVTYPKQYSPTAWPYIGPFYPYPQVPLGWRKVTMEWDDGWWFLDFKNRRYR